VKERRKLRENSYPCQTFSEASPAIIKEGGNEMGRKKGMPLRYTSKHRKGRLAQCCDLNGTAYDTGPIRKVPKKNLKC
jgi:hypothetical protein